MDQHQQALHFVKQSCVGKTCEIVWKKKWGFWKEGELDADFYEVDEFLRLECLYDTICLHILSGAMERFNGIPEKIADTITKSLRSCRRLLILEHNPEHVDFQQRGGWLEGISSRMDIITRHIYSANKPFTKLNWGRNVLFIIENKETLLDSIGIYSAGCIDEQFKINHPCGSAQRRGLDKGGNVFVRSNETPPSDEMVEYINSCNEDSAFISVIGGLAFLDFLPNMSDRKIILTDIRLKQCLFCKFVLEVISKSPTYDEFKINTSHTESLKELCYISFDQNVLMTLDQFISIDDLCSYFIQAKSHNGEWMGRLSEADWIAHYDRCRQNIIYNIDSIVCGDVNSVCMENAGNISYLSSIPIQHIKDITNYSSNVIWTGNWPKCKNEPFFLKKQVHNAQG